MDLKLL